MQVFTVHEPPGELAAEVRAERTAFVKEGFCWPALFIAAIWLLYRRMWWVFLGYLVLGILLGLLTSRMPAGPGIALDLLFAFWFALEANALRRWSLARKGWRMVGFASGRNRAEAERSFFLRRERAAPPRTEPARAPSLGLVRRPAPPDRDPAVIGVFPEPERGR